MGVRGTLQDMSLTGLISINCTEGNQAALWVRNGSQEAYLYFDAGQIAHVVMGDRVGEKVIHEVLAWEEGDFELELNVAPPMHTVHTPWFTLVLEYMQMLDEAGLAGADEDPESESVIERVSGAQEDDGPIVSQHEHEPTHGYSLFEDAAGLDLVTFNREVTYMAELRDLLKEMAGEIQGFVAAAVAGVDGLSIAEYSASPDFNMEVATAQFALVMKLVQKNTVRLKSGTVEDNLVTTDQSYILSRFLGGDAAYYLVVAVDRDMASLGNARLMTRNFAPDLWAAIPRRA